MADSLFRRLAAAMGQPELAEDPRFATALERNRQPRGARRDHRRLDGGAPPRRARSASSKAAGVPATRIFTIDDIFNDPHYAARALDRRGARRATWAAIAMAGVVPRLSATAGRRSATPAATSARIRAPCWRELLGSAAMDIARSSVRRDRMRRSGELSGREPRDRPHRWETRGPKAAAERRGRCRCDGARIRRRARRLAMGGTGEARAAQGRRRAQRARAARQAARSGHVHRVRPVRHVGSRLEDRDRIAGRRQDRRLRPDRRPRGRRRRQRLHGDGRVVRRHQRPQDRPHEARRHQRGLPLVFLGESSGARMPDHMGSRGMGSLLGNDRHAVRPHARDAVGVGDARPLLRLVVLVRGAVGLQRDAQGRGARGVERAARLARDRRAGRSRRSSAAGAARRGDRLRRCRGRHRRGGAGGDPDASCPICRRTQRGAARARRCRRVGRRHGATSSSCCPRSARRSTTCAASSAPSSTRTASSSSRRASARSRSPALARLDGRTVGIVANNPLFKGGALDTDACEKITSFLVLCDSFNIPLVHAGRHAGLRRSASMPRESARRARS